MASGNPSTKVVTALQTPIITTSTVTRMSTTRVATPVVTIAVSTVPTSSTPIMSVSTSGSTANVQHKANVGEMLRLGTPRLWLPAEQCRECFYPNDVNFNFCQQCGTRRLSRDRERPQPLPVDMEAIDSRLAELQEKAASMPYTQRKSKLQTDFEVFLESMQPPKTLMSAAPRDILRFLVWKDKGGRTVVHGADCSDENPCQCPSRLAFKTVDSYIGQLRSIFDKEGRGGEWNARVGFGNPAADKSVKQYLRMVTEEQMKQNLIPKQAIPMTTDKVERIINYIDLQLEKFPDIDPCHAFILGRDKALFLTLLFTGSRAGDLLIVKTENIHLPNGGFLLNHVWGKTLRDGNTRSCAIFQNDNSLLCPVTAIMGYVELAKALGINLSRVFSFVRLLETERLTMCLCLLMRQILDCVFIVTKLQCTRGRLYIVFEVHVLLP
ncbi:uncharacterized protein [Ptychodera flava]|uniref:uncharacterized protein n=1 Tax=Ptychodera flava TaxID=63121 RepID=UPI00396A4BBE